MCADVFIWHECIQFCLSEEALAIYKSFLNTKLQPHPKGNKLRDVPDGYVEQGHCFSTGAVERELIYSFDVCGGCEANAILYSAERDDKLSVETAPMLAHMNPSYRSSVLFRNCPMY